MSEICRSVEELVNAAPIARVKTAVRCVVELNAYPDGHAGIAVGFIDAPPGARGPKPYVRARSLPLNHRAEMDVALEALMDRLFVEASNPRRSP
jgi:hypothetical protein